MFKTLNFDIRIVLWYSKCSNKSRANLEAVKMDKTNEKLQCVYSNF